MKNVKIHIYLNTVILPKRDGDDTDIGHDIIECEIGDNEEVKELELVTRGEPVYTQDLETRQEAIDRAEMVSGSRGLVQQLGGVFTGNTSPVPRQRNRKVPNAVKYRCRIITMEVIENVVDGDTNPGALESGEIVDAEVVKE
jgi:hypothetical protein